MKIYCPKCHAPRSEKRFIVRHGHFKRKSDSQRLPRFRCKSCRITFSSATFSPHFAQKKRQLNTPLFKLLTAGVSQRRAAFILGCNLKTVARKLRTNALLARTRVEKRNLAYARAVQVQFDDVETFEHSKCKPLSITIAVEANSRRILGFSVSQVAAKGLLTKIAKEKYGKRPSNRAQKRTELFKKLKDLVDEEALFESDQDPHYPKTVRQIFPKASHRRFKGQRACTIGQGELKRGGYDPLFWLNHTAAEFRANVNRLFRRTWCTTKKAENLIDHLWLYVDFHNTYKVKKSPLQTTG